MSTLSLLIIEDHPALLETLCDYLEDRELHLYAAATGEEGRLLALKHLPDVIVLDLGLPDMDGLELCRRLRVEHHLQTPILMLTARDTLEDKLAGFDAGSHDYVCKPFEPEELEARIRALARHHPRPKPACLEKHGVRLDPATHEVIREGQSLELTPTGFRMLEQLMLASPAFLSREELEQKLWGDFPPGSDALRTHIAQLRKRLDKPFAHPRIETRYAVGVRFRGDTDAD